MSIFAGDIKITKIQTGIFTVFTGDFLVLISQLYLFIIIFTFFHFAEVLVKN